MYSIPFQKSKEKEGNKENLTKKWKLRKKKKAEEKTWQTENNNKKVVE